VPTYTVQLAHKLDTHPTRWTSIQTFDRCVNANIMAESTAQWMGEEWETRTLVNVK
jgi:hypothetical protein